MEYWGRDLVLQAQVMDHIPSLYFTINISTVVLGFSIPAPSLSMYERAVLTIQVLLCDRAISCVIPNVIVVL